MTNAEKLQRLRELRNPAMAVFQHVEMLKGNQGEKGEKGDTGEQGIQGIQGEPGRDGVDGIDGKDGKDGRNGKDGQTPDIQEVATLAAKKVKIPKPEKVIVPTVEEIISELNKKPAKKISVNDIHDLNKLIEFLKLGGFRGGGSSSTGTTSTAADELATDSGDHTTFTILHTPKANTLLVINENVGQIIPTSLYTNTGTSIIFNSSQQVDDGTGTLITPTFRARYSF